MKLKSLALAASACTLVSALPAMAQTEIQWWHSMTAVNNEWVNDLAKQFNESQKQYKIVPTYKGSYTDSFTAAIAAFPQLGIGFAGVALAFGLTVLTMAFAIGHISAAI